MTRGKRLGTTLAREETMAGSVTCFMRLALAAIIVAGAPPAALAQQGWEAVKALPRGGKLIVETKDKTRLKGRFDSASDTTLKLSSASQTSDLDRQNVARIYRVGRKSPAVPVLAGVAMGAIPGAILGKVIAPEIGKANAAVGAAFVTGIGAGVGLLVWALRHPRVLIYDAALAGGGSCDEKSVDHATCAGRLASGNQGAGQ